ncbi:hypothetical protein FBZ93_1273 [Bradyrhizobium macuxiense]|uniref:Uncharacterized protein n=1 Tax=Bradyrhizobium macuxiense TaxID=1755647 RepID=A0A560KUG2_9BRAD|nr:hypothetical protein [Bradyrhizobium macuxiense]TWB86789.1 hypothetical protein FBZ93_1273 [Bradyrhizobium macuxiense]
MGIVAAASLMGESRVLFAQFTLDCETAFVRIASDYFMSLDQTALFGA